MDMSDPFGGLFGGPESAVLKVLANSDEYRSGSEIARRSGRSHPTAIKVLKRMSEQGLVDTIDAGRSVLYALNRSHMAASPIIELSSLRSALFHRFRREIADWEFVPVSATVFGSVARGDGGPSSDIDLLLVRRNDLDAHCEEWQIEISKLRRNTFLWTGNHLAVIEVAESEVPALRRNDDLFYENVKRDGINVAGRRFSRIAPF